MVSLNDNSAYLTDKHPAVELMDLPGAFNATNRTIQKVANIAIAPHAKYPIWYCDLQRAIRWFMQLQHNPLLSTPSLYDRKSTVSKTAFNEEFSTARNLDHIQSPCKILIESDSADEKSARRGG